MRRARVCVRQRVCVCVHVRVCVRACVRACLPVYVLVRERASERVWVWIGGRGVAIGLLPEAVGNVEASITNLHAWMDESTICEYPL